VRAKRSRPVEKEPIVPRREIARERGVEKKDLRLRCWPVPSRKRKAE